MQNIIVLTMEVVALIYDVIGDPKQMVMNDQVSNSTSTRGRL